ncbi:MAG: hypothetical protein AAF694_28210 [Bacteroidota bacterium]
MNTNSLSFLLKVAAILWIIWGLVHTFAGVITISAVASGNIASGFSGIADAVDPTTFQLEYPNAVGGILGQHGFNLLWFGLVTTIGAIGVWQKMGWAILLNALVGGLADLGYFIFLDLGGFVHFVPGTVMTIVSYTAIAISLYAYFSSDMLTKFKR